MPTSIVRSTILSQLAQHILSLSADHSMRVGINGIDGSGKTIFAAALAKALRSETSHQIIAASIDNFHNPREIRYSRGRTSPEGFYRDSYNLAGLVEYLLKPLSPDGSGQYSTQIFDLEHDAPIKPSKLQAAAGSILIMEGIFLFQPSLANYFDYKIFLDVPFGEVLRRMLDRDKHLHESDVVATDRFNQRYMPGQILYCDEAKPKSVADVIIDNTDYEHPKIVRK